MSKKDAKKGGGSGESDELELLKATCLAKELELFTIRDKMHRLEERSLLIENHIERLTTTSQEKIRSLNDIISLLNGYGKTKDGKIAQLEEDVKRLEMTLNETTVRLTKEMEASDNAHQFKYDALQLQMDAATVKLRELHEFNLRKKAVEEELARKQKRQFLRMSSCGMRLYTTPTRLWCWSRRMRKFSQKTRISTEHLSLQKSWRRI